MTMIHPTLSPRYQKISEQAIPAKFRRVVFYTKHSMYALHDV